MGYSPTLGRWLEQDPIGSPNLAAPGKPDVIKDAGIAAVTELANVVGGLPSAPSRLLQYADGANTYQFVNSNPVRYTDPSGLLALSPSLIAAIGELGGIIGTANTFNTGRKRVGPFYQCYDIATDIEQAIVGKGPYKYWRVGIIGGKNAVGYHHHAVVVYPKPVGGKAKPNCGVVLDGFKPGAGPVKICTVPEFFKDYPNPSDDLKGHGPVDPK